MIINNHGKVLIVEHVFHPEHPWGLPGGWVGNNEDPTIAIVRELQEELQLEAHVTQILLIEKSFKNHIDIAYQCEASCSVGNISKELLDYKWIDPSMLPVLNEFHHSAINIAFNKFHRSQK